MTWFLLNLGDDYMEICYTICLFLYVLEISILKINMKR